jgi:hypothetical protein
MQKHVFDYKHTIKCFALLHQVLLRAILNRHVACVHTEPRCLSCRTKVVVWQPRVPNDQVSWTSTDLLPLEAALLEPLHAL